MPRRLIAASSVLSLAACVASPGPQTVPKATDGAAVVPAPSTVYPQRPNLTTLAWGEEEDGGGTMMTTMAIGEEDGHGPVITTLVHGEEEDGGGTMIDDMPVVLPEPQSFLVPPPAAQQIAPVAEIMARLRLSEG